MAMFRINSILIQEYQQQQQQQVNTGRHASTRISTSATRVNTNQHEDTSPTRVNTNQHEPKTSLDHKK